MITEIGITAGDIWHYLDHHGEVSLSELAANIERSNDLLFMSLGWLAREGHIILHQVGLDYRIALRKS